MHTELALQETTRPVTKEYLVEIYREYSPLLYRYAVRLLGDPDLAEDCVAETFSRFLKAIQKGAGPNKNVKAYLFRIAHNWITDWYRKEKPEEELEFDFPADQSKNPESKVAEEIERERVRKALLDLPKLQREVVMLRFYEEWSHEETAAAIGKSIEATRALQYRAMNRLRKLLAEA